MDGHERIGEKYYNEVTLFTRKMKQLFFFKICDTRPALVSGVDDRGNKQGERANKTRTVSHGRMLDEFWSSRHSMRCSLRCERCPIPAA